MANFKFIAVVFGLMFVVGQSLSYIYTNYLAQPVVVYGDYQKYGLNQKQQIKVYGVSWCVFCKQLTAELTARKIPFTLVDVEKDASSKVEYQALAGRGYPLVIVGNALIHGFQQDILNRELKKLGYQD
jgi:glutaredoxin